MRTSQWGWWQHSLEGHHCEAWGCAQTLHRILLPQAPFLGQRPWPTSPHFCLHRCHDLWTSLSFTGTSPALG